MIYYIYIYMDSLNAHFDQTGDLTDNQKYKERFIRDKTIIPKNIAGCLFYYVVFIGIIPFLLYKNKFYKILEVFYPNVDLIATSLSFLNGPFNSGIFQFLYLDNRPLIGYLSQNFINYIALLSVLFIVIKASVVDKKLSTGFSKVVIILLVTYLLPGRIVINFMYGFYDFIKTFINDNNLLWFIVVGFGLLISVFFILLEAFLIKHFSKNIASFVDTVLLKL